MCYGCSQSYMMVVSVTSSLLSFVGICADVCVFCPTHHMSTEHFLHHLDLTLDIAVTTISLLPKAGA